MQSPSAVVTRSAHLGSSLTNETAVSGVSWAAIAAGGTAAAALSLILLSLGIGLGFSAISPWAGSGVSATVAGISTIVWLLVTQIFASGLGGYLAGRLRTKWAYVHTDEVYFRDTAHGFLAWAAATLVTAAFLAERSGERSRGGRQCSRIRGKNRRCSRRKRSGDGSRPRNA